MPWHDGMMRRDCCARNAEVTSARLNKPRSYCCVVVASLVAFCSICTLRCGWAVDKLATSGGNTCCEWRRTFVCGVRSWSLLCAVESVACVIADLFVCCLWLRIFAQSKYNGKRSSNNRDGTDTHLHITSFFIAMACSATAVVWVHDYPAALSPKLSPDRQYNVCAQLNGVCRVNGCAR